MQLIRDLRSAMGKVNALIPLLFSLVIIIIESSIVTVLYRFPQCSAQLTPSRVGTARSVHVQLGASTLCHKMRHILYTTVTYNCMGELPHFHHGPTSSFLHSQPIQTPPSGPGLICAAGQVFVWDDHSVTPLS